MTISQIISWMIVPVVLTVFVLIYTLLMLRIESRERMLVKAGLRDKELLEEQKKSKHPSKKAGSIALRLAEGILFTFLGIIVFLAIYGAATNNDFVLFGKQVRVVGSNSMATVYERNQSYIDKNGLTERFSTDDLILINDLPTERNIKQYDVIAYKDASGRIVIHRVLEIRQTANGNEYVMRGDANKSSDPVRIQYGDMYGIYGGKIVGAGAIVRFVQSAFGVMAIVFCVYFCVMEEIFNVRFQKVDKARIEEMEAAKKRKREKQEMEDVEEVPAEVVYTAAQSRHSSPKVIEMVAKGASGRHTNVIRHSASARIRMQKSGNRQQQSGRVIILKRRK